MMRQRGYPVSNLTSTILEDQCLSMLLNTKSDTGRYRTEDTDVRWTTAGQPPTEGSSVDILLDSSDGDSRSACDNEPPWPPPGCSSSDGEWVWMTNEDWVLLEEFTETAKCASDMMRTQRDVIEGKGKEGEHRRHDIDSEKALLQEMKQMRLQLAQLIDEKAKLEQDNVELLKNCRFLHSQNKDLKQKKTTTRPRMMFGFSSRKSSLHVMDSDIDFHDMDDRESSCGLP